MHHVILHLFNYQQRQIHLDFGAAYNQLKLDEGYIDDTDFPEPYRK